MKKYISILFACALFLNMPAPPEIELLDAAELQIALDDENTSALAYLSQRSRTPCGHR